MMLDLRQLNLDLHVTRVSMARLQDSTAYVQQVLDAPDVFAQALVEGFRRKVFGDQFCFVSASSPAPVSTL